ncbi:hypothetical protein HMI56_002990 [Coelomomyces lativittatus]|nr:hypothetical protein HMI56_002990 [Coelomomyces lativittatus]
MIYPSEQKQINTLISLTNTTFQMWELLPALDLSTSTEAVLVHLQFRELWSKLECFLEEFWAVYWSLPQHRTLFASLEFNSSALEKVVATGLHSHGTTLVILNSLHAIDRQLEIIEKSYWAMELEQDYYYAKEAKKKKKFQKIQVERKYKFSDEEPRYAKEVGSAISDNKSVQSSIMKDSKSPVNKRPKTL